MNIYCPAYGGPNVIGNNSYQSMSCLTPPKVNARWIDLLLASSVGCGSQVYQVVLFSHVWGRVTLWTGQNVFEFAAKTALHVHNMKFIPLRAYKQNTTLHHNGLFYCPVALKCLEDPTSFF